MYNIYAFAQELKISAINCKPKGLFIGRVLGKDYDQALLDAIRHYPKRVYKILERTSYDKAKSHKDILIIERDSFDLDLIEPYESYKTVRIILLDTIEAFTTEHASVQYHYPYISYYYKLIERSLYFIAKGFKFKKVSPNVYQKTHARLGTITVKKDKHSSLYSKYLLIYEDLLSEQERQPLIKRLDPSQLNLLLHAHFDYHVVREI